MLNNTRIEEDSSGTREVPTDAYHGVHTLRTTENFYIGNDKISDILESARGMTMVKKAATMADKELQIIPKSVANAIIATCDGVLNSRKCTDQFPVDVYQGDAGTSVSMNTNEVLANIGLKLVGHQEGGYQYLNPNDRVSKCQSTNDICPTGFRIAVYAPITKLVDALNQLRKGFEKKAAESQGILKMSHAQLQDAVSTTLGQEFHVSSVLSRREVKNINHTTELLPEVNLGTAAIDTSLNTPEEYSPLAVQKLAEVAGFTCVPAEDLIEVTSNCGTYVMVHGALRRLAVKMSKTCNDLRLFSSGPRTGLNETNLSELQASSSIMPAKMNPAIPGIVDQVRFRVIGNGITAAMASEASQLQLNVMEPVIGQTMFESIHILSNACYSLLERCISGIIASKEACEAFVFNPIGIITYLNPFIGHHSDDIASRICAETGKSVREVVLERGLLIESELDDIFPAQNPMHPAYKAKRYTDEDEQ